MNPHKLAWTLSHMRDRMNASQCPKQKDRGYFSGLLEAQFQEILDPSELCLPFPTGTGNNDIRLPFPFIARTLLGRVMVRLDNGLEFSSVA